MFQNTEDEQTLPSSFDKATITLIPKPDKEIIEKRKLESNIFDEQ